MGDSSKIELVRLGSDDVAAMSELEMAIFPADAWSPEQVAAELNNTANYYVGVRTAEHLVGYAGFKGKCDADLMVIAVTESWRGHGIGRLLLDQLLKEAVDRKLEHMFLEVRASNEVAISLYERRGFVTMGRVRDYYRAPREDARTMRIELGHVSFS